MIGGIGVDNGPAARIGAGVTGAGLFNPNEGPEVRRTWFAVAFAVMGHVARADGAVRQPEIDAVERLMARLELTGEQRRAAIGLFRRGKRPDYPLARALGRLRRRCARRALLDRFLDMQLEVALADGEMGPLEHAMVETIAGALAFSRYDVRRMREAVSDRLFPEDVLVERRALEALGLEPGADTAAVRRAYRRQISRHHPDRALARGADEAEVRRAAATTRRLRQAYEALRHHYPL